MMEFQTEPTDVGVINTLPPMITNNTRIKLDAEQVSIGAKIIPQQKQKQPLNQTNKFANTQLLKLDYIPKELYFGIRDGTVMRHLRVWNASKRSLYVLCTGVCCDKSESLGASWCCYPRTRSLLAPGIAVDFYIKAKSKNFAPVPSLHLALQLKAAYKRDTDVSYIAVPIVILFLNYISPYKHEDE